MRKLEIERIDDMETIDKRTMKIIEKIAIFAGTILLLYLIYKFAIYFMPFLIAGIIAILIEPLIRFCMNRLKLSRRVSSFLIVGLTIVLLGLAIFFGVSALIRETINLTSNLGSFIANATDKVQKIISDAKAEYNDIPEQVITGIENSIISFLSDIGGLVKDWANKLLQMLFSVPKMLINIVITILALIFFTKDRIYVIDMMEHHMPKTWIKKIMIIGGETLSTVGGYIRVYVKIMLITFAELYFSFNICRLLGFDIEYPFMLAVVIAVVDILPILGVGGILVPWAIWLLFTGQVGFGIALVITYLIILIIRQFLEPKLVSKQFGIHPIVTLFAMYAGFRVAGVFGLILGPVILMILKSIFAKQLDNGFFKEIFDEK